MLIIDLPKWLQDLAIQRIKDCPLTEDFEKEYNSGYVRVSSAFSWRRTIEGKEFWGKVNQGIFPTKQEYYSKFKSYYNTTNLKGEELQDAKTKAADQDFRVFGCFKDDSELSASDIYKLLPDVLLTSVRRSLNTLEKEGKITKSGKKQGIYGRKEFTFKKL